MNQNRLHTSYVSKLQRYRAVSCERMALFVSNSHCFRNVRRGMTKHGAYGHHRN